MLLAERGADKKWLARSPELRPACLCQCVCVHWFESARMHAQIYLGLSLIISPSHPGESFTRSMLLCSPAANKYSIKRDGRQIIAPGAASPPHPAHCSSASLWCALKIGLIRRLHFALLWRRADWNLREISFWIWASSLHSFLSDLDIYDTGFYFSL